MDIITACKKMVDKGLVVGASGNVSEKTGQTFRITASGTRLDSVVDESTLLTCEIASGDIPKGASMETPIHRAIYVQRPDVGAVIHANPIFSTIVACAKDLTVDLSLIPEGTLLDPIYSVGAYPPGSKELAEGVGSASGKSNVLILKNHGVVTVGESLEEALNRMQYFELICRIIVTAKSARIELSGDGASGYR